MVMLQVAVPPLRVVIEVVHEVKPAVPLTDHVTVPVGVAAGPDKVAVKVTLLPRVVGVELVTTSDGVVLFTVKVVEALTPPVSVAVTVLAPAVALGTVKVADQAPLEATTGLAGLTVSALPPNVTLTVVPGTKPAPVRVIPVLPGGSLVGETARAAFTAKVPETPTLPAGLETEVTVNVVDWTSSGVMDAVAWPELLKARLLLPVPQLPAAG
jgi:hypothetical protein